MTRCSMYYERHRFDGAALCRRCGKRNPRAEQAKRARERKREAMAAAELAVRDATIAERQQREEAE